MNENCCIWKSSSGWTKSVNRSNTQQLIKNLNGKVYEVAMELGFVRGFFYSRPHQLEISYYPEILIEMAHNVTELCTIFNLIAFIRSHSDFYFFGVLLIGS